MRAHIFFYLLSLVTFVFSTITVTIQDPVPLLTRVVVSWTRTVDDLQEFLLVSVPTDPTKRRTVFARIRTSDGQEGQERMAFNIPGPHNIEAIDARGNILARSNPFNVGDTPISQPLPESSSTLLATPAFSTAPLSASSTPTFQSVVQSSSVHPTPSSPIPPPPSPLSQPFPPPLIIGGAMDSDPFSTSSTSDRTRPTKAAIENSVDMDSKPTTRTLAIVLGIIFGVISPILLLVVLLFFIRRRRRRAATDANKNDEEFGGMGTRPTTIALPKASLQADKGLAVPPASRHSFASTISNDDGASVIIREATLFISELSPDTRTPPSPQRPPSSMNGNAADRLSIASSSALCSNEWVDATRESGVLEYQIGVLMQGDKATDSPLSLAEDRYYPEPLFVTRANYQERRRSSVLPLSRVVPVDPGQNSKKRNSVQFG